MDQVKAAFVITGSEILTGRRMDELVAPMAARASSTGIAMQEVRFMGDDPESLAEVLTDLAARVDLLVVTGGLGRTPDDTTRMALERLRSLPDLHVGASIENPVGSEPGIEVYVGRCRLVFLPGVPMEALAMAPAVFEASRPEGVQPLVEVPVFGYREVEIAGLLGPLADRCAFLPREKEVVLLVPAHIETEVRSILGRNALGEGGLASDLGAELLARGLTCAAAESCTGGLIGHLITQVPGSSAYFLGSVVAYSNEVKARVLGVDRASIEEFGAVSAEVARGMLRGVLTLTGAEVGMAVTGIAGPEGGSPGKPVGTAWICAGDLEAAETRRYEFRFDRAGNKMISAKTAMFMLRGIVHDKGIRGRRPPG
jgi:nicotinamide-nucleotide amidase